MRTLKIKKNLKQWKSTLLALSLSISMIPGNLGILCVMAAIEGGERTYAFGTEVTADTLYTAETGVGFSDTTYPDEAIGWSNNIYYPRHEIRTEGTASYIADNENCLEIKSKVWTETEVSGYGVFQYENTSAFDLKLDPKDYHITVEFVNPTDTAYYAAVKAENISKASGIEVGAGQTVSSEFTACLIDGLLNLKFLSESNAVTEAGAAELSVYVKSVTVIAEAAREAGAKPTVFLASDSTVQTYEDYYDPQTGWGETLWNFFGELIEEREAENSTYYQARVYESENAIVENRAIGGRSSKSFVEEGKLDDLLEDIKPGDFLFVQFGHNDATAVRPNRYVAPADFEQWLQNYVNGAGQRGAVPVLVTPVARYSYDSEGKFKEDFKAYGDVMRKMAEEQNIPLIDLSKASIELCDELGMEGATSLFLHVQAGEYEGQYANGVIDNTHLQYYGAYKFAECVAKELSNMNTEGFDLETKASLQDLQNRVTLKELQASAGDAGRRSSLFQTREASPKQVKAASFRSETLTDRSVVAINLAGADGGEIMVSAADKDGNEYTDGIYLSWRSFTNDPDGVSFNVYRNNEIIAQNINVTNLVDESGTAGDVYKVMGSSDSQLGIQVLETTVWNQKYLELSLSKPADQTMPDGQVCSYLANDMSVGDLDGDGQLELIVKWIPSNSHDNAFSGYSGTTIIDGYDVDFQTGEAGLLWRIDMGINIRSGAHYTQFQVWDFDGDGKAEIGVKTADGTTTYRSPDGTAAGLVETGYVGAANAASLPVDIISEAHDYRNSSGYILSGPEYFTIFNGEDGTIVSTAGYIPERGDVGAWGDTYGNRADRFLSAVAYLDGETPYAVFARGYYTRTCLTAYYLADTDGDTIGDSLRTYWEFDTNVAGNQYEGQGNHGLSINDIDGDGKDEIIYGALVIDDDGTVKYSTNLGHGDAMHVSDWVLWNPGLEVMSVHEHSGAAYHVEVRDGATGEILMGYYVGKDTGRGAAGDIDPTAAGAEFWSIAGPDYSGSDSPHWNSKNGGVYSTMSDLDNLIVLTGNSPASNGTIFWDGDLLTEIQDHIFDEEPYLPLGFVISKWDYENNTEVPLMESSEVFSNNGTKGNAGLVADILGDWREEIIVRSASDDSKVRIYATTIQTDYVVPCLLENRAYREGIAWQNVAYNQPANLDYLLSEGLVTAELKTGEITADTIEVRFTPASDGVNGHAITAYEIYRSTGNAEYEIAAVIPVEELQADESTGEYRFTDRNLNSETEYAYKAAAVVDEKTSFMSRAVSGTTQ